MYFEFLSQRNTQKRSLMKSIKTFLFTIDSDYAKC